MSLEITNQTLEEAQEIESLEWIAKLIPFYNSVCILPIGILFNIISFFIFSKKSLNNKTNLGYLCCLLTLFNTFALINVLTFDIFNFYNIDIFAYSQFNCMFFNQLVNILSQYPSMIQVLIAFELYTAVCRPAQNRKYSNRRTYAFAIFAIFVLLFLFNSIYYFGFHLENEELVIVNEATNETLIEISTICTTLNAIDVSSDSINILLRAIIPFIIIFSLNAATIRCLVRSKRRIRTKTQLMKRESSFATATIWINLIFLAIYLPWIFSFITYHTIHFINDLHITETLVKCEILINTFNSIACFNNYSLFFISVIFNSLFRKEVFTLFKVTRVRVVNVSTNETPTNV